MGKIYVGIGGWTFEPWRGTFYPDGLTQKRELEYASRKLNSIEVNGTFYGSQKPESFAKWHDETPDDFVFSLKGPRFATNRRVLAEAKSSIARFIDSGIAELKNKLGVINWQLAPTKKFDRPDFEAFLKLLPPDANGNVLRHAIEVRHESFCSPDAVDLARKHGVALVMAGDSKYPCIDEDTAPFIYARIMGTVDAHENGYSDTALDAWANRIRAWAAGVQTNDGTSGTERRAAAGNRDVFVYVISGHKERNPAAAMALMQRLSIDRS